MNQNGRRNLYILSFTLFVVMLGFGLVIPIIPFYMESMGAGGTEMGLLVTVYATMRLIFGPLWGALSDRIGRKPVLMIGVLGYGITMLFFGLATQLWMMFLARGLSGVLSSATSPTTMAYIGDTTSSEERSKSMGVLGAVVGIGTILGPAAGGLLGSVSFSTPFFIAAGLSFLALLFVWVLLPESLPQTARQEKSLKNKISLKEFRNVMFSPLGILLWITTLAAFATASFFGIFGLYALQKFSYGTQMVGVILMVVGFVSALTQGLLIGPLTKCWGEVRVIQGGLFLTAASFILISFSGALLPFLLSIGLLTLASALLTPAVMSLTSQWASLEQGITMGFSNAFQSLGRIIGPTAAGAVFDLNYEYPNYLGGFILLMGGLASLFFLNKKAEEKTE